MSIAGIGTSRNAYSGMTEVTLKEVDSTERIDDDLTQLGNQGIADPSAGLGGRGWGYCLGGQRWLR